MPTVTLQTTSGRSAGSVELAEDVFGIQPNVPAMHQAVTAQLAHRRAGTQSTKTRAEVRGGGRKPYKQKGTGNARQGSIRAPHYAGGGITHAPKPRSYTQKVNKKVVRLALNSALSDRAADNKILVVDTWGWSAPRTKDAVTALAAVGATGRALVVVRRDDLAAIKSFRNLPEVQIIEVGELNAYDVLCNEWIVFTSDTLPAGRGEAAKKVTPKPAPAPKQAPVAIAEAPLAADDEVVEQADDAVVAPQGFASIEASDSGAGDQDDDVVFTPESFSDESAARWAGSAAAPADGSAPEGFDIKGNADSMLYHLPDSRWYDATIAEVWFDTEESAIAAGFTKAGARKAAAADKDDE